MDGRMGTRAKKRLSERRMPVWLEKNKRVWR